jgi:hypothetical protein
MQHGRENLMATKIKLEEGGKITVTNVAVWGDTTEVRVRNKDEGIDVTFTLYGDEAFELGQALIREAYIG